MFNPVTSYLDQTNTPHHSHQRSVLCFSDSIRRSFIFIILNEEIFLCKYSVYDNTMKHEFKWQILHSYDP